MMCQFLNDESGVIISAEIVLLLTITVLGVIVGLNQVAISVNTELNDLSNAIGALQQTYGFSGFIGCASYYGGSGFIDGPDDCDNYGDIVAYYTRVPNSGG